MSSIYSNMLYENHTPETAAILFILTSIIFCCITLILAITFLQNYSKRNDSGSLNPLIKNITKETTLVPRIGNIPHGTNTKQPAVSIEISSPPDLTSFRDTLTKVN